MDLSPKKGPFNLEGAFLSHRTRLDLSSEKGPICPTTHDRTFLETKERSDLFTYRSTVVTVLFLIEVASAILLSLTGSLLVSWRIGR